MKCYLFTDYDTGEDFIVEANNSLDAFNEASLYFADPSMPTEISEEEAEQMGVDIY